MTDIQDTIARLRELDRYASPAPWVFTGAKRTGYDTMEPGDLLEGNGLGLIPEIETVCPPVDAELIAEARNAIPALLAEIERLGTRLAIAEARLGRVAASHPEAYLAALEGDKE